MNNVVEHINETFYGKTITLIAEDGYAYVMISILKDSPQIAVIHDLVVHKTRRRQGIGTMLLNKACAIARKNLADSVMLSVAPDSWLEAWYLRNGFRDIGQKETVFGEVHNVLEKLL